VTLMHDVAGLVLIGAEKGLFVAGPAPAGGCDAMLAQQRPAPGQPEPRPVCVAAVDAKTGAVHALGNYRDFMLIGAEKGLFLAREQGGKVTVAPVSGDGDTGRVLAVRAIPGGALIGTEKGLFAGRAQADGTLSLAPVAGVTGPVQVLHELPGVGVLVGTENGLFLARVEQGGRITVGPTRFVGQVLEMHEFPGGGVLIRVGGGLILARAANGTVTLAEIGGYAGSVRSLRRFAGGVMVEEENKWMLVREERSKVTGTRFGDDVAGRVDAVGQFVAGGLTLLHGENGWFTARPDGDKVTFAPAGGPDTDRVLRMAHLGSGLLAQTENGWFFASEASGKVSFARIADAQTGEVFATHELSGGALLIGAERGLLVAREQGGKVTLDLAGHSDTGPALILRELPGGGVLIGAAAGWFVGRTETGGNITLAPAGSATIGRVVMNTPDLGLQMRDFGGALLIGAEVGLLVAGPVGPGCGVR
jgi:hypothetical protein